MMHKQGESWASVNVICPFYCGDSDKDKTICCEGIFDGTDTIAQFAKISSRNENMHKYCMSYAFKDCKVHKSIYLARYANNAEEKNE